MAIQTLSITRNWLTGQTVVENCWDSIRSPLIPWSSSLVNDVNQIRKDCFGSSYSCDNDGNANLSAPLRDWVTGASNLDWIFSAGKSTTFLGTVTLPSSITFDQTTADVVFSIENPAAGFTLTFPDAGGADSVAYLDLAQTFTNKTLTAPAINGGVIDDAAIYLPQQVTGISASVTTGKHVVLCTAAGVTITLTTAIAAIPGYRVTVIDVSGGAGASAITIDTQAAETINGLNSVQIVEDNGTMTFEVYSGNFRIVES